MLTEVVIARPDPRLVFSAMSSTARFMPIVKTSSGSRMLA